MGAIYQYGESSDEETDSFAGPVNNGTIKMLSDSGKWKITITAK